MFRRRIYAQGFTILAMLGGSIYWESDRSKRDQYNELIEEKKKREKHEAWLRELEIRAEEDDELRKERNRLMQRSTERHKLEEEEKKKANAQSKNSSSDVTSVLESIECRRGPIYAAVAGLWRSQR